MREIDGAPLRRRALRRGRGALPFALARALAVPALAAATACLPSLRPKLGVSDLQARAALEESTIVYSRGNDLYLAHGDGSDESRLLAGSAVGRGGAIFLPALDRAGKRVLFLSVADLDVGESTGRDLSLNILTLHGPVRPGASITAWRQSLLSKIAPPGPGGRQAVFTVAAAGWSSDSRIALALDRPGEATDVVVVFDAQGAALAQYALTGRKLPRVGALAWTPDGHAIFLGLESGDERPGVVARLDVSEAGGAVLGDVAAGSYPTLSPDGDRLAVLHDPGGPWSLALLDLSGQEVFRFERPAGRAPSRPFWSADGRFLYYYSLGSTGPLGLVDVTILRCLDLHSRQVFDLLRL